MGKTIYITEQQEQEIINRYLRESLVVNSAQVKHVLDYLNRSYRVNPDYDDIGPDGLPKETIYITYYIQNQPKMNLQRKDLVDVLSDKFRHFVKDDASRYAYMNQILGDWMSNKIRPTGQLSVNVIDDNEISKFNKNKSKNKNDNSEDNNNKNNNKSNNKQKKESK